MNVNNLNIFNYINNDKLTSKINNLSLSSYQVIIITSDLNVEVIDPLNEPNISDIKDFASIFKID